MYFTFKKWLLLQVSHEYFPDLTLIKAEMRSFLAEVKWAYPPNVHLAAELKNSGCVVWAGIPPPLLKMFVYGVSKPSNDFVT